MRFEPFAIDTQRWRLLRAGEPVDLSPRLVEILACLAARPGAIVTKDELLDRFWPGVHVTENTLTRAVADIRKALGDRPDPPLYIQTVARRGYRFIATIEAADAPARAADEPAPRPASGSLQDAFVDWVRGRAMLESLDESELIEAVGAFERTVTAAPDYAAAHVGLANAYFLQFERSRVGNVPDQSALERAVVSARRAAALDTAMGEAWATLGFVLAAAGSSDESRAAARHAVAIEPASWRHHYRLAVATWGEERLRAVDRTLALLPTCPAAHFLAAMVHVARRAWARARAAAVAGAAGQSQQTGADHLPLAVAGLHWMTGLVDLAHGDDEAAMASFAREIAGARHGHIYGREFAINARGALGFVHVRRRELEQARQCFAAALAEVPGHARSRVGLAVVGLHEDPAAEAVGDVAAAADELRSGGKLAEAEILTAAFDAWIGRSEQAVARLSQLVEAAPPGSTGWSLGVDPALLPMADVPGFDRLLARVAARAA